MALSFKIPDDFERRPIDAQLRVFSEQLGRSRLRATLIEAAVELSLQRRAIEHGIALPLHPLDRRQHR